MTSPKGILYLIDGSSYIYRAFYAVRHLSTSTGIPTNAVFGFIGMLNRVLKAKSPEYIAIALDAPGPTFRHDLSSEYKANRPQMPEDLSVQMPYIKRLINGYRIPCLEIPGYEADDIIGTLATWASGEGMDVVMISGDKDLLQLVSPRVHMWDTMKDEVMGPKEVEERFGVSASQLVEIMGLAGDSSDNIPGVPGIGPKTAVRLIKEFGSVERLLSNLEKIPRKKEREKLETYSEEAKLSRQLATIHCEVPLVKDWQHLELGAPDRDTLISLYRELEFKKFLQELEVKEEVIEPAAIKRNYDLITSFDGLEEVISKIYKAKQIAISILTADDDPLGSELVGMALAWAEESACYLPFGHDHDSVSTPLDRAKVLQILAPVLSDPGVAKIAHHSKLAWIALKRLGIELAGMQFDPMLGAYVLDPSKRVQNLDALAKEHLNVTLLSLEELVGTGRKQHSIASVPMERVLIYAGDQAAFSLRLAKVLDAEVEAANQASLFHEIELPLVRVLARMEMKGVRVDVDRLGRLAEDFSKRLEVSAGKIYEMAGERFNINSPQQLGEILFDKLGLPVGKKTKTGYSTSMDVLSSLATYHPLPDEVLHYRSLTKLKNTYVEALPRMVKRDSGRIHTSYNQTITATGRLSSSEPNLQNIPIRTEEGRKIRRAFVADPGCVLISADYSQIELRILAHYSEDEALIDAFHSGEDIHLRTAAEIFGLPPDEITVEMRRQAKTINFGIIYGMSPFRLARDLDIPQATAREIIDRYFERYQGVRSYVKNIPEVAREQGFVTTIFNRKRFLPDLNSRNHNVRSFAERTAINTPIQGSAADIIKLAMIQIDQELEQESAPAQMIMQVHDELVLEAEASVAEEIASIVKQKMESVASLAVPLIVEVGYGVNWDEVH
ncbi:MAG: DNA polymerase I [Deltaproteobacteria bacterium]|nr:MAG: DNA polymerase I [Deltaproteobacteria bacterium]